MLVLVLLSACERTPGVIVPGTRPSTTPPSVEVPLGVSIEPADPRSGYDDLRCVAEGAVSPVFRWTADGVEVHGLGDTVPAERTRLGHVWVCAVSDGARTRTAEVTPRAGGNLLVLLADDLGREKLSTEGVSPGTFFPQTPNLEALAARSVRFENAWATPVCTPTRGTIMTGRMPRQNGIGDILYPRDDYPMPDDEVFLPQVLAAAPDPVTSVLVGKWHLNVRGHGTAELQPGHAGFAWWRSTNGNLASHFLLTGGRFGYGNWEYNVDGELSVVTEYATEVVVRDAIDALATLEPPWMLYVGLHAAHDPFHVPPPEWSHTQAATGATLTGRQKTVLMIESADIAVGRILDAMTDEQRADTTVVFLSDNGSMFTVSGEPFLPLTSKGSPYQGGVNVPFWVSGPLVGTPGRSDALVQTSDLFDTALALAGVLPSEADALVGADPHVRFSESILPYLADPARPSIREVAYTEKFIPNGPPPWNVHEVAVRDERWKLIRHEQLGVATHELYDLWADPFEAADLLLADPIGDEPQAARDRLMASLADLEVALPFEY